MQVNLGLPETIEAVKLSGRVFDIGGGVGLANATIMNQGKAVSKTDSSGDYLFKIRIGLNAQISASKLGYTFTNPISLNDVQEDQSGLNFTALSAPDKPQIVTHPQNQSVTVNGTATFSVNATGSGILSYQWWKNGAKLSDAITRISGSETPTLTVSPAHPTADPGEYWATVTSDLFTNPSDTATSNKATLTVGNGAFILRHPTVTKTLWEGDSYTLSVSASGDPVIRYQWMKDGAQIAGATNTSLTLGPLSLSDSGDYRVKVENDFGSQLSNIC